MLGCSHRRLWHDRRLPWRGHWRRGAGTEGLSRVVGPAARRMPTRCGRNSASSATSRLTCTRFCFARTSISSSSRRPSGAHMEPAVAAANAGKHVVVEKPLEITLEAAATASSRRAATAACSFARSFHHVRRRQPRTKKRRKRRALRPAHPRRDDVQVVAIAGLTTTKGAGRGRRPSMAAAPLMNPGDSQPSTCCSWMMGPVTHISGMTTTLAHEHIEVEDTAVACLRFKNGRPRGHPGDHQRLARFAQDHRRPRRSRHRW